METMSLDELRVTPEKIEPFLKKGETVVVTKNGKPFFNAVPSSSGVAEFARKIGEVWAGSGVNYSNEQIVELIRKSRGDDRSL